MVWRLTLAKEAATVGAAEEGHIAEADRLRRELEAGFAGDAESYQKVLQAFKQPKETEEQKAARSEAIQSALQHATLVPLANARLCLEVMELAREAAGEGYQPSITDAGVGGLLAHAGVVGCLYNVELNLQSVKDQAFAARVREEAAALRAAATDRLQATEHLVLARMNG
jgi:formiminotetrahydrofolate cyclodeaminase